MPLLGHVEPYKKKANLNSILDQLEAYALLNDVDNTKKSKLLLTFLSTEVYDELKSDYEPALVTTLSWDEIKSKLKKLYDPDKGEYSARVIFRDRKQKQHESIEEYILALRRLSIKCKFSATELKTQLKDQLISGVNSKLMNYELLKEAEKKNLDEILEVAKTVEIANGKASDVENKEETTNTAEEKETSMHQMNTSRDGQDTKQQYFKGRRNGNFQQQRSNFNNNNNGNFSRRQQQQRQQNAKQQQGINAQANVNNFCKYCGKNNHLIFQCSLRFKYCSECGIQGHVFRMCPSRNNDFRLC